jgi:hypothetical protein
LVAEKRLYEDDRLEIMSFRNVLELIIWEGQADLEINSCGTG